MSDLSVRVTSDIDVWLNLLTSRNVLRVNPAGASAWYQKQMR